MQIDSYDKQQILKLLENAKNIAVIPSKIGGIDSYCAALGLYYMLKERYEIEDSTKHFKFVYQGVLPDGCANLINEDEIVSNLNARELNVTVDYTSIPEANAYFSNQEGVLYLTIKPVPKDFDTDRVKIKVSGFDFDLVILVGAPTLNDLGHIYISLKDELTRATKVNIDNTNINTRHGLINVIDTSSDSLSHLVLQKASELGLIPSKKAAKALLQGILSREPQKVRS